MTEQEYIDAIPKCCLYQTLKEHEAMMLCWGLCRSIENNTKMVCGECELNIEKGKAQEK